MQRNTKIRLYSFILATTIGITSLSGCKKDESSKDIDILSYSNFEEYACYRLRNGRAEMCYKGQNIAIAIDKETNEVRRFIYNDGRNKDEVYNLDTGEMIYYSKRNINYGTEEITDIIDNSFIIKFSEINNYFSSKECQEWYNIDEINEVENTILRLIEHNKTLTKKR